MRFRARDLVLMLAAALVLSACGGQSASESSKPAAPSTSSGAPSGSGSAPASGDPQAAKIDAAKKEGKVVWYTSSFDLNTAKAVAEAFQKKYGIPVEVTRVTSQQVYQRIRSEIDANAIAADVITLTDEGRAITLDQEGHLLPYQPVDEDKMLPAYRGISKNGTYHTHSVGLVLISYNTQKMKKEEAPRSWKELLDPKWKGKISIGHPGASGYVGTWFVQMQMTYGWDYLAGLAANNPLVGQSINDTIPKVLSGERLIGVSSHNLAITEKAKGSPIDVIVPEEGAILMTTPSMIMKKAPHPNAAKLFQDFQFSKEVSEVYVKHGASPLRPDVPDNPLAVKVDQIKTLRPPGDVNQKMIPEVIEKFRSTFGV